MLEHLNTIAENVLDRFAGVNSRLCFGLWNFEDRNGSWWFEKQIYFNKLTRYTSLAAIIASVIYLLKDAM